MINTAQQARETTMGSIPFRTLKPIMHRSISASALRIALSVSITTPQPAIAQQPGPTVIARTHAPIAVTVPDTATKNEALTAQGAHRKPEFAEPDFGWG